ncbi:dystrophin-like isoform X2 [Pomacea canaliculata]|uniref:dystrophin-like isoform X2 n=1 Tax=Pomacea canaliculata TaxID=400727 RepID=UPI000D73D989|nr:dystrophin-like isoform X2 [Pomacea canaliculata]
MPPIQSDEEYDAAVQGWECRETNHGVPYYLNGSLKKSTWDHPYYTRVLEELEKYQTVHYAAYRTALKLRHLQKKFGLDLLSLHCLQTVLDDHGFPLGCTGLIDCQSLQLLLLDMFHSADFRHFDTFRQDAASELLLNYLMNLLDRERSGNMNVRSVKLVLAALCSATLPQKYRYFWEELQTSHTHARKDSVAAFIQDLIQIPDLIKESSPFGKNVAAAVSSCVKVAGSDVAGITEKGFYSWLMREPQTIIWLPTLHRLTAAETVKHDCKCNVCKQNPIVGFRYKCLQCFKYNICQDCFFHGRVSKQHHPDHPIQEYCLPATPKDDTKAFIKIIHNKLRPRSLRKKKLAYLPVDNCGNQNFSEWRTKEEVSAPSSSMAQHSSIEIIVDAGTVSEDDSGHSSDHCGDGCGSPLRAPPSPSPLSYYDNSTSPVRYLQEHKPNMSQNRMTDRHSLIHLVHRLRRENRALRQQLRGGLHNHSDKDLWTSHATAEVIAEVTVEPSRTSQIFADLSQTDSQDTVSDNQELNQKSVEKEQPEFPISPITETSTALSMCYYCYTSECFNSILDGESLHSHQSSTDCAIKGIGVLRVLFLPQPQPRATQTQCHHSSRLAPQSHLASKMLWNCRHQQVSDWMLMMVMD